MKKTMARKRPSMPARPQWLLALERLAILNGRQSPAAILARKGAAR